MFAAGLLGVDQCSGSGQLLGLVFGPKEMSIHVSMSKVPNWVHTTLLLVGRLRLHANLNCPLSIVVGMPEVVN